MSDLNVNDLLDATLDDLEDLPEFANFPPGAHRVKVSLGIKEINKKQCVEMSLTGIETLELSNPEQDAEGIKEGQQCSLLFMLDNEFGRGKLKKIAAPLGESLGTGILREIIDQTKDIECVILSRLRKDKNDPDKAYMDVKELAVE